MPRIDCKHRPDALTSAERLCQQWTAALQAAARWTSIAEGASARLTLAVGLIHGARSWASADSRSSPEERQRRSQLAQAADLLGGGASTGTTLSIAVDLAAALERQFAETASCTERDQILLDSLVTLDGHRGCGECAGAIVDLILLADRLAQVS